MTGTIVVLAGEQTSGRVTMLEQRIEAGDGPPLHLHDAQDEAFYVLAGLVRFRLGDELLEAEPGMTAFAPRGMPHCFQNVGTEPARLLVVFTPAGMEEFFAHLDSIEPGALDADTLERIAAPYGMHVVGPTLEHSHPRSGRP